MGEDSFHLGVKALIRNETGAVLLLKVNPVQLKGSDNKDYWDLPGGRIQKGHTVDDTLEREVAEEIGVAGVRSSKPVGMVLSNIRIPIGDDTVGLILSVWECQLPADAAIALSEEHVESEWFSPAEAAELLKVKYPADFCVLISKL